MVEPTDDIYAQPVELPGGEQPLPTVPAPKPSKRRKAWWLVPLILLVIVGLGYGGLKLFGKKTAPTHETAQTEEPTAKPAPQQTTTNAAGKTFTAETLAVEFQYPADWTVTEKDGTITAKSTAMTVQSTTGGVSGAFRVYIRKVARDVDSKYIGRAVAMQATEPLTYSNPAPSQRKTTNLSFFGYDDANNFAFFMITGNFNLKKGDTLGANYGKEADTYIIVGGYSSATDKDDLSFRSVSPNTFKDNTAYKQAIELLKSLKVS